MARPELVAKQRQVLERQLARVGARNDAVDAHLHNRDREMPQDFADQASVTANDEVLEALGDLSRDQIGLIRDALARMDADAWGECMACGDEIPEGRLEAVPWTALCTGCARAAEG